MVLTKLVPENLTYTQRKLWHRHNYPLLDMEMEMASYCSNYRQLEFARDAHKRAVTRGEERLWELEPLTRTGRLLFYRRNLDLLDKERDVVGMVSNWQQLDMARKTWATDISRCERSFRAQQLLQEEEDSEYSSKIGLWLHQAERKISQQEENRQIRADSMTKEMRETVTKTAVDIHRIPWDMGELEAAASSYLTTRRKVDELQEELNSVTMSLMTSEDSITKYGMTAREMAVKASREDEEAVKASRKMTRKVVMESNSVQG